MATVNANRDIILLTVAQTQALHNIYSRSPIYVTREDATKGKQQDFNDFVAGVQPTIAMDGAVTIQWAGMWLCIERDGYTHS